jgi:hypothetical protein
MRETTLPPKGAFTGKIKGKVPSDKELFRLVLKARSKSEHMRVLARKLKRKGG